MSFDLTAHERRILEMRALAYQCKVCFATPDVEGWVEHSKGCYQISQDGGGPEYVADEAADLLLEAGRRIAAMDRMLA